MRNTLNKALKKLAEDRFTDFPDSLKGVEQEIRALNAIVVTCLESKLQVEQEVFKENCSNLERSRSKVQKTLDHLEENIESCKAALNGDY